MYIYIYIVYIVEIMTVYLKGIGSLINVHDNKNNFNFNK